MTKTKEKPIETRTRVVTRKVTIHENRCQWCGEWFETQSPAKARYCLRPKICRQQAYVARRES